jgi:hypothetical protein
MSAYDTRCKEWLVIYRSHELESPGPKEAIIFGVDLSWATVEALRKLDCENEDLICVCLRGAWEDMRGSDFGGEFKPPSEGRLSELEKEWKDGRFHG